MNGAQVLGGGKHSFAGAKVAGSMMIDPCNGTA